MKIRAHLWNPVLPGKLYNILDRSGEKIAEEQANSASEALRQATAELGKKCRIAVLSSWPPPAAPEPMPETRFVA